MLPQGQAIARSSRTTRPRLAVAYDVASASPMGVAGLLDGLCEILWVVDAGDPSLGSFPRLLARLGLVFDTSGMSVDEVAGRLRTEGIDGVVAFSDSQLPLATTIADSLDLPCNPPHVVARLNNKRLQREALYAAGLVTPASCRIPGSADVTLARELTSRLSFPIVVKPCFGDSSREVHAVARPEDLAALFGSSAAGTRLPAEEFLAEEFLADRPHGVGPDRTNLAQYVSVETIVQDGEPIPLAITGKFPLAEPFRETGNFMPHVLDGSEADAVLELSRVAARAIGVRSGALHTEIKLTPSGPRVIEVNGRIGGGGIDAIYARRHDRSLTELAARVALGQHVDLVPEQVEPTSGPYDYEYFVQPPADATRISSVRGAERIVGTAGATSVAVNRGPGDEVDWRAGSQGYVLQVSGRAADLDTLASVPTAVLGAVDIAVD